MTGNENPVPIRIESIGVPVHPCNCLTTLFPKRKQVPTHVNHLHVVRDHNVGTSKDTRLRDQGALGALYLEPGVPAVTVERLRAMGYLAEIDGDGWRFGGYQAIAIDHEMGSYAGATEMRTDGTVAAY